MCRPDGAWPGFSNRSLAVMDRASRSRRLRSLGRSLRRGDSSSRSWSHRQERCKETADTRVDSVDRAGLRARFHGWRIGRHPGDGFAGRFAPSLMSGRCQLKPLSPTLSPNRRGRLDLGLPSRGRTPNLAGGDAPRLGGTSCPLERAPLRHNLIASGVDAGRNSHSRTGSAR